MGLSPCPPRMDPSPHPGAGGVLGSPGMKGCSWCPPKMQLHIPVQIPVGSWISGTSPKASPWHFDGNWGWNTGNTKGAQPGIPPVDVGSFPFPGQFLQQLLPNPSSPTLPGLCWRLRSRLELPGIPHPSHPGFYPHQGLGSHPGPQTRLLEGLGIPWNSPRLIQGSGMEDPRFQRSSFHLSQHFQVSRATGTSSEEFWRCRFNRKYRFVENKIYREFFFLEKI